MNLFGYKISRNSKKDPSKSLNSSSGINPALFSPTLITNGQPVWRNLSELSDQISAYHDNFVVNALFNIRAEAKASVEWFVKDLTTKELTPINNYDDDKGALRNLILNPNPLQNGKEWIKQDSVNYDVFGDSYVYATVPAAFDVNYLNITTLKNLPPYLVSPVLTGRWLESTTLEEIITRYDLTTNGDTKSLSTNQVFHQNNVNILLDQSFTQGRSKLIALKKPISNIDEAYKARNVLINKRGAIGMISPEAKDDAVGAIPFEDEQIKQMQESAAKYGIQEDQYMFMFMHQPMKYTNIAMNVKDLGLIDEVSHAAMPICHSYGVPVEILKHWIQTGTLGSDSDVAQKKLYEDTIIPEVQDRVSGLNRFLKTKDKNIELVGSFDHLKVLQSDKKKEAETNKIKTETAEKKFFTGAILYGEYIVACDGEVKDSEFEKMYYYQLPSEMRDIIKPKQLKHPIE